MGYVIDTVELKKRVDLRGLIERETVLKGGPIEYYAACPKCGGTKRFHYHSIEDGWFCRHCTGDPSVSGWHDVIDYIQVTRSVNFIEAYEILSGGDIPAIAPELSAEREAEAAAERARVLAEQERKRAELDASGAWKEYHRILVDDDYRYLWEQRGLSAEWQDYFGVGVCLSRKFYYGERDNPKVYESASLTIPTFHTHIEYPAEFGGDAVRRLECVALTHRVFGDNPPCGKYRPHISGTGKHLFRTDLFDPGVRGPVFLVEGEIKAAVTFARIQDYLQNLINAGAEIGILGRLTVVGTAGAGFKRESAEELKNASEVYICFDPEAEREAVNAAGTIGRERCRIVELPWKIDDMFLEGSLSAGDLPGLLEASKRV